LIEKFKKHHTDTDGFTGNLFESTLSSSTSSLYFSDASQQNDSPDLSVLVTTEQNQNGQAGDENQNGQAGDENRNGQTGDDLSSNIDYHDNDDIHVKSRLPADYTGPTLSERIQYYIDQNNLAKFNPHTTLRAELLSLLFDDVTKTHQLL